MKVYTAYRRDGLKQYVVKFFMESLNYEVEVREREKQSLKPRSKEVSRQRSLTAKESHHRKEVSQQRCLARKLQFHNLKLQFFERCLAEKPPFHNFNLQDLRDVSH